MGVWYEHQRLATRHEGKGSARAYPGRMAKAKAMASYQRARRIATWRGSFIALTFCTGWLLLIALAGNITQ